jgi:uncharacterized Zn finger protein
VAERRREAQREMAKRKKRGQSASPVTITGRTIARTFWGGAWCDNLERYGYFSNRLPGGRTYVRNGSVLDLQIAPGAVKALVSGSEIYDVEVKVLALPKPRWASICRDCAGAIDSLVELLQGRFSKGVMERICRQKTGLFPAPAEIEFSCSCPDWASMCKHVAAVLYGIGARLDERPELLFMLRSVDEKHLIAKAGSSLPLSKTSPAAGKVLADDGLSELFGLDMGMTDGMSDAANVETVVKAAGHRRTAKSPLKAGQAPGRVRAGSSASRKTRKTRREPAAKTRRPATR